MMALLICNGCSKEFFVKPSRVDKAKYCSKACKNERQKVLLAGRKMPEGCRKERAGEYTKCAPAKKCGHITKKGRSYCPKCRKTHYSERKSIECAECGTVFELTASERKKYKCCSYKCRNAQISKRQKGSKSHLWRGGVTSQDRVLRNSAKYENWRKSVFSRDDYTCQLCGERGGRLTADHIREWFLYPELRFDIENGRTLCVVCHRKTDNFGGKAYAKMLKLSVNGSMQYRLI